MTETSNARKLSKADAERLIGSIDTEGFADALGSCLAIVLGVSAVGASGDDHLAAAGEPDVSHGWAALIDRAALVGGWSEERRANLTALDLDSLYDLATELNERRTLP